MTKNDDLKKTKALIYNLSNVYKEQKRLFTVQNKNKIKNNSMKNTYLNLLTTRWLRIRLLSFIVSIQKYIQNRWISTPAN